MGPVGPGQSRRLMAVYQTYERARDARDGLIKAGLSADQVEIRGGSPGVSDPGYGPADEGFWNAVRRFLLPSDEADYAEAIQRGHVMLMARPKPEMQQKALELLQNSEPLDLEAQLGEWRAGSPATTQTMREVPSSEESAERVGMQTGAADQLASASARRQSIGRVRSYALDPPGTYAVPRMSGAPEEEGRGKGNL